jgi:hypothetical protein
VTASLFKNGYAVVVREVPVAGTGEITLTDLPQPSLGTFWVSASQGIQIESLRKTTVAGTRQKNAESLSELLEANVGKEVAVTRNEVFHDSKVLTGTLLSVSGNTVVIKTDKGVEAFSKDYVIAVSSPGEISYHLTQPSSTDKVVVTLKADKPGSIFLYGLEQGLSWAPSYAIDISDPKKATVTAKSTVLDDLASVDNVELKFVTGNPNVIWENIVDPFFSGQSVSDLVKTERDSMAGLAKAQMQYVAAEPAYGGRGGGSNDAVSDFNQAFAPNQTPGMAAEDLFFYRQPSVTLKRGDRAYYVLFKFTAPYEHLYTWDIPDFVGTGDPNNYYQRNPAPQPVYIPEVWHSLKFKDEATEPLTSAPATIFRDGEIMGQDLLKYTTVGSESVVRMSRALDVHADQQEEEVSRERGSLKLRNSVEFDLVTLKGTIELDNLKNEPVKMRITKSITGDETSIDGGAKVTKEAKGLQAINSQELLEWTPTLAKGQKLTLTYTYKVYVRS